MNRPGILAVIAFALGCGGPSAAGGGSGAIGDAAGSGGATTGSSGSFAAAGGTAGGSTGGSGGSGEASGSAGGTGELDAASPDPKTACTHYVQAYCEREGQCQNLPPSSVTACEAFASLCPDYFFSPGSSRTPSQVEACAADVLAQGCDDLNEGVYLPCQTPGTRKPGDPCSYNSQCETLLCARSQPGGCGACAPIAGPGDDCTKGLVACPLDEVCDTTRGIVSCDAPSLVLHGAGQGASCGPQGRPCDPPLECILPAEGDAQAGTCLAAPDAGAPCEPVMLGNGTLTCEPLATCNTLGGAQCVARVPEGQPCDFVPNGDPCVIGTYCDIGDAGTAGVCHANRAAGQPCAVEIFAGGYRSMGGCMSGECTAGICAPLPPQPLGLGGACEGDAGACAYGLRCENGACQTAACGSVLPEAGAD